MQIYQTMLRNSLLPARSGFLRVAHTAAPRCHVLTTRYESGRSFATNATPPPAADSTQAEHETAGAPGDGPSTVMTNPQLETLRIKGGKLERAQLNALSSILRYRMTERLPTLMEFQGPQATMNAVKAIVTANGMMRGRKKIEVIV